MRGLVTAPTFQLFALVSKEQRNPTSLGRELLPLCGRAVARRAEDVFRLRKRLIKFSTMRLCDCIVVSPLVKLGDGEQSLLPADASRPG
jgi:hypothetical protein